MVKVIWRGYTQVTALALIEHCGCGYARLKGGFLCTPGSPSGSASGYTLKVNLFQQDIGYLTPLFIPH